ncbi:hypothetical protein EFK07_19630 [Pseudomonas putida]|uniref:Uncharacterized protein n=1 Tax=Pseudomonas putida TaxID=303 RepID=A0A3M8T7V8_PSEPU|nr:hypothetical protein EFK07_19630 [Pseudomonas putida]
MLLPVPALSRVNPLPRDCRFLQNCGAPVGAGLPAKRPVQAVERPGLHRMLLAWPATPLRGASQAGSARGAGAAIPL